MARSSVTVTSYLFIVLTVLTTIANAYNDDRPIYKWSPLWFNSYLRRGVLHKRFNEDSPIYKWSPLWLDRDGGRTNNRLHYYKRAGEDGLLLHATCLPEWAACRIDDKPCCSGACFEGTCIGSGEYYDADYEKR